CTVTTTFSGWQGAAVDWAPLLPPPDEPPAAKSGSVLPPAAVVSGSPSPASSVSGESSALSGSSGGEAGILGSADPALCGASSEPGLESVLAGMIESSSSAEGRQAYAISASTASSPANTTNRRRQ